jgi:hypothetical protein
MKISAMSALALGVALGLALGSAGLAIGQPYGGYGYGMGPGMMGGYGMGPGMMGGYGMGPGTMGYGMGLGMMGARNRECNADGSVPNFGFPRNRSALNLSIDDIKNYVSSSLAFNGNANLKLGDVQEANPDTITANIVTKDNSLVEQLAFDRHTGFSCFVVAAK